MLSMRFSLKPIFFNAVLIALFLCSAPASAASFAYLYVEANEGNSSGGHSAIQFGDEIYHYQHHDSGLIRLLKQDKPEFHFQYRFLQNRRIHLSHIEVSEETFTLLREHFKLQFLAQEQQFKQLHNLNKDRVLLRRLLHKQSADDAKADAEFSSVLGLKGAGLFYAGQELDRQDKVDGLGHVKAVPSQSPRIMEMLRKK